MSLVGSLEDLGLGDILQIVSLSRKSGLLVLRSDAGEGRIILRDGQVRAAFVKGEPLTGEAADKAYLEITRKYYGHDQKICEVPDYIAHEWAFIPHFYLNFYVFQYATSFTASAALEAKVKAGDPEARKRYLAFISAGGSKYPIDLLKDAGVDMTTSEPLDATMARMNRVMDEYSSG